MSERDDHRHRVVLDDISPMVPLIFAWGSFALLLVMIGLMIFAWTDWRGFLAFMPWLFKGTIYACGAACILGLSAFAIKHVIGG